MDTIEAIRTRRSIRRFSSEKIGNGLLTEILLDARAAPSAGNLQARDFVVIRQKEKMREIAQAALGQYFIAEADVVIVVCANQQKSSSYGKRGRELYCIQDANASVMNILLSVHARGLASIWIGAFDENRVSRVLHLPAHVRPIAILPIGYPVDKGGARTSRHPIETMVHYEGC